MFQIMGIECHQITMEDLQIVEHICRTDPGVIEQCVISGIPKEDMHKVYCDRRPTSSKAYSIR
jgi:Cu2+-containing amine oxidase